MSPNAEPASKTILIVDDTPANLRLLASLLSTHGYVVRLAPNGNLALMAIQHDLPDLILLDIRMPKMDGYEVCQRLKADDLTREIPVIFLSALQEGSDKAKAFEVGGADYITKPFQTEEVIARVRHQLQLLDLQQQLQQQHQSLLAKNQQLEQEIRDRTRVEAELSQEKTLLRSVIDVIPDFIFYKNQEGRYLVWNQAFEAFTGLAPAEILHQTDADLFSPEAAEWIQAKDQQVLTTQSSLRYEEWATFSNQARRLLDIYKIPVQGSEGNLLGLLGVCRDITERKANEQTLVRTSQILAAFSDNLKQLHRLNIRRFDNFENLAEAYLTTGCQVMNFSGGVIGFLEDDNYVVAAIRSQQEGLYPNFHCNVDETFCSEVIKTQQTITYAHIGHLPALKDHPFYQAFKWESLISTPIFVDGDVYGSLCFFSHNARVNEFDRYEKEIVELIAQGIGKFISSDRIEQQRQQAETALRESEARFRQLTERIENVFWILEPSQQRFTYVSPAYETIWGRPCEAVLQNPHLWETAIYPEDTDRMAAIRTGDQSYDEEYRIVRPDGSIRWIRDRAFPIADTAGQVYRIVGIAEDITELKRQEQALRLIFEGTAAKTGSDFFHSLVRYLAEVLQVQHVVVGQQIEDNRMRALAFWRKGRFLNDHEYPLSGTPCQRVLEDQIVFHDKDVQLYYPHDQDLADWGITSYLGVPLANASNKVIGHLAILDERPMPVGQFRELTLKIFAARAGAELERQTFEHEIQRARKVADAANRAKSEFLANISHELRTPLNAIMGFTQLILGEGRIDAKTHEYLDIVNRSGDHLLTLINDVLEMSKIEAGKVALRTQPFDLFALFQSLEDMFSLRAKAKNLRLSLDCASDIPRYVEADESKLRQVLINLLGNAVKFTQSGHVRLSVAHVPKYETSPAAPAATTPPAQLSSMTLLFRVEDTGVGITSEDLKTVFDPFIQTTAGHQSQEGTGLGLPISQRFVQLMGGTIQVQTTPGEGSTFAFEIAVLPVVPPGSSPSTLSHQIVKALVPGQPQYRLLVVEDHRANQLLLVRMLETVGFAVKVAEDGLAAVEQAKAWRPHLIWMDIQMPRMNGYEATREIKSAGLQPVPVIIALTASAFEEERARVLAAGCDDFVRKPFQSKQIFQKMAHYLPVRYLYRANSDPTANGLNGTPSTTAIADNLTAALRAVPPALIQALKQAAIKGSDEQILQLIAALPPEHSALARILTTYAQNFQFDSILEMLQCE
ncbi:MAG: response regulator [Leptolyngbya sp. SIO1E4]|nr:response regulator [Leptolyngbya sp. SIO1E4]